MITQIQDLPDNMVGFKATSEVTKEDFENTVLPAVKKVVEKYDKLNYMLVLDTDISKFTPAAWMMDAWLGVKNLFKWNRGAIVTDSENIRKFTDGFSYMVPGEFKGFSKEELQKAIDWTSEKTEAK